MAMNPIMHEYVVEKTCYCLAIVKIETADECPVLRISAKTFKVYVIVTDDYDTVAKR